MSNRKFNIHLNDLRKQTNAKQWKQSTIDNIEIEGDKMYNKQQKQFNSELNKFSNVANQFDKKTNIFTKGLDSLLGLNYNENKQADDLLKQIYDEITLNKYVKLQPMHHKPHSIPKPIKFKPFDPKMEEFEKFKPFDPKMEEFEKNIQKILNEERQTKNTVTLPKIVTEHIQKNDTQPQQNTQKAQDILLKMTKIAKSKQKNNPKWDILRTIMQKYNTNPEKVANYVVQSLEKQGKEVTSQNIVDHFQKLNEAKKVDPERMARAMRGIKSENMSRSTSTSSLNTESLEGSIPISFSLQNEPIKQNITNNHTGRAFHR